MFPEFPKNALRACWKINRGHLTRLVSSNRGDFVYYQYNEKNVTSLSSGVFPFKTLVSNAPGEFTLLLRGYVSRENFCSFPSSAAAACKVSRNWSQKTMTCHSFYCFSIVWGQGNAPLVTSLPNRGYICSGVVGGVMANVLVLKKLLRKPWDFTPTWWVINRVVSPPRWGGGGYSLIWPIWGCASGQGMIFVLSVLNRLYNFARVCPKQGI